jgi:hypothetical protein
MRRTTSLLTSMPNAYVNRMHAALGSRFFDHNIRYGLGESEAVNRAISRSLRQIVLDRTEQPSDFAFNHNGITLFAEKVEPEGDQCRLTAPRLLNGAQTVMTVASFREANKDNPRLAEGQQAFERDSRAVQGHHSGGSEVRHPGNHQQ